MPINDWSTITNGTITYVTGPSGSKPVVVSNGVVVEAKDLDEAQSTAEALAHKNQGDAFILKPVKKVSPKREVITTDL